MNTSELSVVDRQENARQHLVWMRKAIAAGAVVLGLVGCTTSESGGSMYESTQPLSTYAAGDAPSSYDPIPSDSETVSTTPTTVQSSPEVSDSTTDPTSPVESDTPSDPATSISRSTANNSPTTKPSRKLGMYEPPDGTTYVGVSASSRNNQLTNFVKATGMPGHPAIFNSFVTGNGDFQNRLDAMTNAGKYGSDPALAGSTLMLSWDVDFRNGVITNPDPKLNSDTYLKKMAHELATYDKPVFIRLNWEMNSYSFKDYNQKGGTTPEEYKASWIHVRNLFKQIAPKAAFVWCPGRGEYNDPSGNPTPTTAWYPGKQYVDWIGIDGYPEYAASPTSILTTPYGFNWAATFAKAEGLPLAIPEWSKGPDPKGESPVLDTTTSIDVITKFIEDNDVKMENYFDLDTTSKKGPSHQLEAEPAIDPMTGKPNPSPFPNGLKAYLKQITGNKRFIYSIVLNQLTSQK